MPPSGRCSRTSLQRWETPRRRRDGNATNRHPIKKNPTTTNATTMNAGSIPCPDAVRTSIPRATVISHTGIPGQMIAAGRFHAHVTSHPATSPTKNGQYVVIIPPAERVSPWLRRPIITKTRTSTASSRNAPSGDRHEERCDTGRARFFDSVDCPATTGR